MHILKTRATHLKDPLLQEFDFENCPDSVATHTIHECIVLRQPPGCSWRQFVTLCLRHMVIVNCLQRSYTPAVDVPEELYFKKNQDGCQDPYLTKCYV